jgi:hypothetical protein
LVNSPRDGKKGRSSILTLSALAIGSFEISSLRLSSSGSGAALLLVFDFTSLTESAQFDEPFHIVQPCLERLGVLTVCHPYPVAASIGNAPSPCPQSTNWENKGSVSIKTDKVKIEDRPALTV